MVPNVFVRENEKREKAAAVDTQHDTMPVGYGSASSDKKARNIRSRNLTLPYGRYVENDKSKLGKRIRHFGAYSKLQSGL